MASYKYDKRKFCYFYSELLKIIIEIYSVYNIKKDNNSA